jgi:hypothetical protein
MARYQGRPSKATIEAAHPCAVWVRVPLMTGVREHLDRLHKAAKAIGTYATTSRMQDRMNWVRFGFPIEGDASRCSSLPAPR